MLTIDPNSFYTMEEYNQMFAGTYNLNTLRKFGLKTQKGLIFGDNLLCTLKKYHDKVPQNQSEVEGNNETSRVPGSSEGFKIPSKKRYSEVHSKSNKSNKMESFLARVRDSEKGKDNC